LTPCGNNGQGDQVDNLDLIRVKSTPNRTPAFIPNKWADPLGTGGADPIRVKTELSTILCENRKLAGK
jgi:hypothetical protein